MGGGNGIKPKETFDAKGSVKPPIAFLVPVTL